MDQERWYAEAFCSFRSSKHQEDRVQEVISYIRSISDLVKGADVTSVLAIGTGNSVKVHPHHAHILQLLRTGALSVTYIF